MQIGSQHVSYHAEQRTYKMLHACPQTMVKEVFLYLDIAIRAKILQFFPSTQKHLLPLFDDSKKDHGRVNQVEEEEHSDTFWKYIPWYWLVLII